MWWLVDSSLAVTDIQCDPHGGGYMPCFSDQKDIYWEGRISELDAGKAGQ